MEREMNKYAVFYEVGITYIDGCMYVVMNMAVFHNRIEVDRLVFSYEATVPDAIVADQITSGYDIDGWRWQHAFALPLIPLLAKGSLRYCAKDLM
jgi:hypothetical protein